MAFREKNLEVSKKEAKAKEKKNEEKQAASKDDVDIDHEERLQEVFEFFCEALCATPSHVIRSKKISMPPLRLPNNEPFKNSLMNVIKKCILGFTAIKMKTKLLKWPIAR